MVACSNGLLLTAWGWSMLTLRDAATPAMMDFSAWIKNDNVAEIATLQYAQDMVCPSSKWLVQMLSSIAVHRVA